MTKTMLSLLSLLALFVVAFATPIDFQSEEIEIVPAQGTVNYRLNEDVIPTHYKLELTPYFAAVSKCMNNLLKNTKIDVRLL